MNNRSAIVILLRDRYANSHVLGATKFYIVYQKPSYRYYYVICRIDKHTRRIAYGAEHPITKQKLHDTFVNSDEYLYKALPISYKYKENMVNFLDPFLSRFPPLRFKNRNENQQMLRDFSSEQIEGLQENSINAFDIINIMTNICNKNDLKPVLSDIFEEMCAKSPSSTK